MRGLCVGCITRLRTCLQMAMYDTCVMHSCKHTYIHVQHTSSRRRSALGLCKSSSRTIAVRPLPQAIISAVPPNSFWRLMSAPACRSTRTTSRRPAKLACTRMQCHRTVTDPQSLEKLASRRTRALVCLHESCRAEIVLDGHPQRQRCQQKIALKMQQPSHA